MRRGLWNEAARIMSRMTAGVWTLLDLWSAAVEHAPTFSTRGAKSRGVERKSEVVRVIFDPAVVSYGDLLRLFWENHDPTQGMRQGNDVGSTYRSGIYCYDEDQQAAARALRVAYQAPLTAAGRGTITTEILPVPVFYFAEDYHQQYLAKNPQGYCGIGGTGVSCPIGLGVSV